MFALPDNWMKPVYRHPYLFWFALIAVLLLLLQIEFEDPMQRDDRGRTALYLAAEHGDLDRVKSLLQQTGQPDQCDDCLWTPLMRAAQNGHLDVVNLLLEAGADVNAVDKAGYSVLMVSAMNNNAAILQTLIRQGAEVDSQDPDFGWTALIWSAREGHPDNVEVLINAGANLLTKDKTGLNAMAWARKNGHQQVTGLLSAALSARD